MVAFNSLYSNLNMVVYDANRITCDLFTQTLQKEITQNQGDVALLLKAGNDLLEGREGAAGSDEIQVSKSFHPILNLAEFILQGTKTEVAATRPNKE